MLLDYWLPEGSRLYHRFQGVHLINTILDFWLQPTFPTASHHHTTFLSLPSHHPKTPVWPLSLSANIRSWRRRASLRPVDGGEPFRRGQTIPPLAGYWYIIYYYDIRRSRKNRLIDCVCERKAPTRRRWRNGRHIRGAQNFVLKYGAHFEVIFPDITYFSQSQ